MRAKCFGNLDTKEKVKAEMDRLSKEYNSLPKNVVNLNLMKRIHTLQQFYNENYCTKKYYMDELGRVHFYYEEIKNA